jgi:hypothetical protein
MTDSRHVLDRIAAAVDWTGSVSPELDWDTVERDLKTSFPGDYREFMDRFPSGLFRNSLVVWNPVQNTNCLAKFTEDRDRVLMGVRMTWEAYDTFPPFPEPKGVIPFATDATGGALFWLPWSPDPDKWYVVYQSRHDPEDWTRTKRSMTAVMLEFATSRSARNILGWDMSDRSFEPY